MIKTYIIEKDPLSKTKINFLMCRATVILVAPSIFQMKKYCVYVVARVESGLELSQLNSSPQV